MHGNSVNTRGRDLETAGDTLKVIMSMVSQRHLTTSGSIVRAVNELRRKQKRPEISERMIRKTISFLAGVGAIEKRTLTFDKLVDYEDNIRETKALRSVYQISKDKVRLNTINMDIEDYRERISKLPSDIQQELVREKRRQLVEIVYMKTLEDLIIDKTVNVSNVNSRDPRVKAVLSYVHHKDLGEIVDYLHRLRE
jgi:CRISPR/Cas system-associated exonuclease Cas4 (RecB family)